MRDLKVNWDERDLDFEGNDFSFVSGNAYIIQSINATLQMHLGERIFHHEYGLDYKLVLGSAISSRYINTQVRNALKLNPNIQNVLEISSEPVSQHAIQINMKVLCNNNETIQTSYTMQWEK